MDYHYEMLDDSCKRFYREVLLAYKNVSNHKIKLPHDMSIETMLSVLSAIKYDYPSLYYVDFNVAKYNTSVVGIFYIPGYYYTIDKINRINRMIESKTQKILNWIKLQKPKSKYHICALLHGLFVKHYTYNYDALDDYVKHYSAYTIEQVLLEKKGVCAGFALTYMYLCQKLGVEALCCIGDSFTPGTSKYEKHAWNSVKLNNNYYQMDVTWDICNYSPDFPFIRYDYFFLRDLEMLRDHTYIGFPYCGDKSLDYFEKNKFEIETIDEARKLIKKVMLNSNGKDFSFCFRLKKKTDSEIELMNKCLNYIQEFTSRAFRITSKWNAHQSVFYYNVKFN